MNNKQGFTLIELLVVVLIMGILASVAMPQYFKSVEKSRASEAVNVLSSIAEAQQRAYMQSSSYATNMSDLDIGMNNLSYFTVTMTGNAITAERTALAGGGLGKYKISLTIPSGGVEGKRTWACSPTGAGCTSFLPIKG